MKLDYPKNFVTEGWIEKNLTEIFQKNYAFF